MDYHGSVSVDIVCSMSILFAQACFKIEFAIISEQKSIIYSLVKPQGSCEISLCFSRILLREILRPTNFLQNSSQIKIANNKINKTILGQPRE
jgi:hypothetical protein